MQDPALVHMIGISKSFAGNPANTNIDLEVKAGEIHAILGENGAGKSTLMNILTGLYKADSGSIYMSGEKVTFHSPRDAINAGIGMIHQHFRLVSSMSVADNIILGHPDLPFVLKKKEIHRKIMASAEKFSIYIDPALLVSQLSVGEQQRVEILKALYRGSEVLILDEPTAVLTPQEARDLFFTLKKMADAGKAVIVITHKLREVMEIADRITVLRSGLKISEVLRSDVDEHELARLMVGRDFLRKDRIINSTPGETVLSLENVSAMNDKGIIGLKDIDLTIRSGEILGIAGVAGNGQKELCEMVAGLRPLLSGSIRIQDKKITKPNPLTMIQRGVAYIPDDRLGTGLVPGLDVVDNMILKDNYGQVISSKNFIDYRRATEYTHTVLGKYHVKVSNIRAPVKLLSGGNLQRVLFAREMAGEPVLIVASYPIRGLDIEATETVHDLLLAQKERGAGVLLVSEDLEEIFKLSDRIAVLFEGEIMGIVNAGDSTPEEIGMMMLGKRKENNPNECKV
jgi:general nucleoside transport system ATP-binding protein